MTVLERLLADILYFFKLNSENIIPVVTTGLAIVKSDFGNSIGNQVYKYLSTNLNTGAVPVAALAAVGATILTGAYLKFLEYSGTGCFTYDDHLPNTVNDIPKVKPAGGNYLGFLTDRIPGIENYETVDRTSSLNTSPEQSVANTTLAPYVDDIFNNSNYKNFLNWFGNFTGTLKWEGPNSMLSKVDPYRLPTGIVDEKPYKDVFVHAQQLVSSYKETDYCSRECFAQGFANLINMKFPEHDPIRTEELLEPGLPPDEFIVMFTLVAVATSYSLYKSSGKIKNFIARLKSPFSVFSKTVPKERFLGGGLNQLARGSFDINDLEIIKGPIFDTLNHIVTSGSLGAVAGINITEFLGKIETKILLLDHYIAAYRELKDTGPSDTSEGFIIPNFIREIEEYMTTYTTNELLKTIFNTDTSKYEDVRDLTTLFRDWYNEGESLTEVDRKLGVKVYMHKVIQMVGNLPNEAIDKVVSARNKLFDIKCSIESERASTDLTRKAQSFLEENLEVVGATIPASINPVDAPKNLLTHDNNNNSNNNNNSSINYKAFGKVFSMSGDAGSVLYSIKGLVLYSIKGLSRRILEFLYNRTPLFGKVVVPLVVGGLIHLVSPDWVRSLSLLTAGTRTFINVLNYDFAGVIWDIIILYFSPPGLEGGFTLYQYQWVPTLWKKFLPSPTIKNFDVALSSISKVYTGSAAIITYITTGVVDFGTISSLHITYIKDLVGSFSSKIFQMATKIVSKFINLFTSGFNQKIIGAMITIFTVSALGYNFGDDAKMLISIVGNQLFRLFSSIGNAANGLINTVDVSKLFDKNLSNKFAENEKKFPTGNAANGLINTVDVSKLFDKNLSNKFAENEKKFPTGGPSETIAKGKTIFDLVQDFLTVNGKELFKGFYFPRLGWVIALIMGLIVMMLSYRKSIIGEQDEKIETNLMKLKLDKYYTWIEHMESRLKLQDELFVQVTSDHYINNTQILEILGILNNYNSGFTEYDNHLKNWCNMMASSIQDNSLKENFVYVTKYWITSIDSDIVQVEKFISEIPTMKVREVMFEDMSDIVNITNKLLLEHIELL